MLLICFSFFFLLLLLLLLKWKKNSFSYWLFILPSSVYFILNTGGTWYRTWYYLYLDTWKMMMVKKWENNVIYDGGCCGGEEIYHILRSYLLQYRYNII